MVDFFIFLNYIAGVQKNITEQKQLFFPGGNKMKKVAISLNSIDKVKSFVNTISKFDSDFDLISGRYVIDAKSIMGIFSLDLSQPIELTIHADDDAAILEAIKPYQV